ncbi:MAG: hypothetical protein JWN02_2677 [Acidobacteria bacterium]|nr:hypothetical protein [Acidobacteriota bacterium]
MMFSPTFRETFVQLRDDHRVYWRISSETEDSSGARAYTTLLSIDKDAAGNVSHAGGLSFIPRTSRRGGHFSLVTTADQAALIGHEGGHLLEIMKTGQTLAARFNKGEAGVMQNSLVGPNSYESTAAIDLERKIKGELAQGRELLPEPVPVVTNPDALTPKP